jgi:hypothetical protein
MGLCKIGDGNAVLAEGDWFCPPCAARWAAFTAKTAKATARTPRLPAPPAPYVLRYRSVDGFTKKGSFKTRAGARGFIEHWLGLDCDAGATYLVGRYGDRTIHLVAAPAGETLATIVEG